MQMIDVVIEVLAEVLPEAKAVEINSSQIEDTCGSLIASQIPVKKPELTSSIATALQEESGAEENV